jgi:hypothetical protein
MSYELSLQERKETVTKGYLNDFLEGKNYVTKQYLDEKDYVSKDYLHQELTKVVERIENRIDALIEHQMHMLQSLWEHADDRYVLRSEWLAQRR